MATVLLAALAGAAFGALAVVVRWGLRRGADPEVGALVAAVVASLVSVVVAAPSAIAHGEMVGRRTVVAGLLIVSGGGLIGALR